MVGFARGMMILKRITQSFAPSILADSSNACGMPSKPVIMIIRLNVLTAPGIISASLLLIIPRSLIRR